MEQILKDMKEIADKFIQEADNFIEKQKEYNKKLDNYKEEGICSICFKKYTHWGNNAWPVNEGRCCDECNSNIVIPARIQQSLNNKEGK